MAALIPLWIWFLALPFHCIDAYIEAVRERQRRYGREKDTRHSLIGIRFELRAKSSLNYKLLNYIYTRNILFLLIK